MCLLLKQFGKHTLKTKKKCKRNGIEKRECVYRKRSCPSLLTALGAEKKSHLNGIIVSKKLNWPP